MDRHTFKNHYFVLRHGESISNTRGVILSNLDEGRKDEYTLTENGEEQVALSVQNIKETGILNGETLIYSSPFSRCRRTAAIAKDILGMDADIIFDARLRERWFGDWDRTSNTNYQKVWDDDILNGDHKTAGVESTAEVAARVSGLVHDIEALYSGKNILLVSHGDALQILQTVFEARPSSEHRGIQHLKVAEIRRVN